MPRVRFGHCVLHLVLVPAAVVIALPSADADQSFQSGSTLDAHVAPQDLNLDAAIASMVRRGLLADIDANKPAPAPLRPPVPAVRPQAIPAPPTAPKSNSNSSGAGWRAAGSGSPAMRVPAQQTPRMAQSPHRNSQRPHTNYNSPNNRSTNVAPRQAPVHVPGPAERQQPAAVVIPPLVKPIESAPRIVVMTPAAPSTPAAPIAQAAPAPPADEHLAPIDSLPETPAPAADAPGDPREPELGDEQLEGALLPQPKSATGAPAQSAAAAPPALPARSSVAGSQLTPVGEPDRIVNDAADGPAPEDPEKFEQADEVAPTAEVTPALPPLTRNQTALREKVRRVLKHYYNHPLNTGNRSPWEVMHQMLAFEVYSRIRQDGPSGQPVTAVGWLCFNRPCKGRTLMYLNEDGDIRVKVGPALQGHHGQLLALLAQARVRSDYPMMIDGKEFTVADLIEMEKSTCYPRTELTFKLIGLQRYLDLDARWMNDQGMAWDFPTLLREEMRQPVRTAACGGTHRLSGLILTTKKSQRTGKPLDGAYLEASRFVANYQNYAYRLQNPDGSFSTEWFKGAGAEEDIDRRLKTTGHQLEFLLYAANDEQLTYYRTVKAVNYLANIMWANRDRDWEAGPLGHAIHALVLYDRLAFAKYDQPAGGSGPVAHRPSHVVK